MLVAALTLLMLQGKGLMTTHWLTGERVTDPGSGGADKSDESVLNHDGEGDLRRLTACNVIVRVGLVTAGQLGCLPLPSALVWSDAILNTILRPLYQSHFTLHTSH